MSLSAECLPLNVQLSFYRHLSESELPNNYQINYGFEDAEAFERAIQPNSTEALNCWLRAEIANHGVGQGSQSVANIIIFGRVRTDPQLIQMKKALGQVIEVMNVAEIPLYDFADPENPQVLNIPIMVLQNNSTTGIPQATDDPQIVKLVCSYKLLHWAQDLVTP